VRFGEDFAALAEALELERDGVPDFLFDLTPGPAGNDAAGKIGRVRGVAGAGLFDDNQILFHNAGKASEAMIRQRSGEACRKLSQDRPVTKSESLG